MISDEDKSITHTKAIAVKGNDGENPSRITAKGEGKLAEKMLDIAFSEGVKVRQDKDLTEILSSFEIESPVPLEALHAVSLILERVYTENTKQQEDRMHEKIPSTEDIDEK